MSFDQNWGKYAFHQTHAGNPTSVFFFFKFKNMTFGYCFSPCGIKLATSWNGFESSWLKGFFQIIFLANNEGEMEFNQAIVFFSMVVCFWL